MWEISYPFVIEAAEADVEAEGEERGPPWSYPMADPPTP